MIDMRHKPFFLPQVNSPVDVVLEKLSEHGIDYEYIEIKPEEFENVNVSQGFVFSDDIENIVLDDKKPMWLDKTNNICDGHHKFTRAMMDESPIKAIRIDLNFKDACRILNKIQDILDYDKQLELEEAMSDELLNSQSSTPQSGFLSSLEENNTNIQSEMPNLNPQKLIAFRKDPIKENSVVGNFFTLKPIEGFGKYEIEFDNLLDTKDLGVSFLDSQVPVDMLAKLWFPHVNFEELGKIYNTPAVNLKNKAIVEKAHIMGYDGIKYGDAMIQGLK